MNTRIDPSDPLTEPFQYNDPSDPLTEPFQYNDPSDPLTEPFVPETHPF